MLTPRLVVPSRTWRAALPASLTLGLLVSLAGCTTAADANGDQLTVATTVSPLTSIAANIGGNRVDIEGIILEGSNSHTFEPQPQVAALLSTADVIFVNGLGLEGPTQDLADANMKDGAVLVELGDQVFPRRSGSTTSPFPKKTASRSAPLDRPHYAIKYAEAICETFSNEDPANARYYERNLDAFTARATALEDALTADQKSVPDGNLTLLTYHDAYAYFARTYGWQVIGAVQPKNFEDPTPQEVAAIIDQVKLEDVPTIFGSEVFPSAVLAEIGRATGASYEATLRDDDLPGEPGDADHSWLGLMKYDYITMIEGLGGSAQRLSGVDTTDVAPDEAEYPQ